VRAWPVSPGHAPPTMSSASRWSSSAGRSPDTSPKRQRGRSQPSLALRACVPALFTFIELLTMSLAHRTIHGGSLLSLAVPVSIAPAAPPVALNPDTPRYFLFRGKPLVLIAASEHYGSVLTRAFDFDRYLEDAARRHQTMTRTFLLYRELQTPRNPSSPCKPESPDDLAPWPRPGAGTAIHAE